MPIFEYHCSDCGQDFEELLTLGNEATACKHCESQNIKRKFSCFATRTGGKVRTSVSSSDSCTSCRLPSCTSCGL